MARHQFQLGRFGALDLQIGRQGQAQQRAQVLHPSVEIGGGLAVNPRHGQKTGPTRRIQGRLHLIAVAAKAGKHPVAKGQDRHRQGAFALRQPVQEARGIRRGHAIAIGRCHHNQPARLRIRPQIVHVRDMDLQTMLVQRVRHRRRIAPRCSTLRPNQDHQIRHRSPRIMAQPWHRAAPCPPNRGARG